MKPRNLQFVLLAVLFLGWQGCGFAHAISWVHPIPPEPGTSRDNVEFIEYERDYARKELQLELADREASSVPRYWKALAVAGLIVATVAIVLPRLMKLGRTGHWAVLFAALTASTAHAQAVPVDAVSNVKPYIRDCAVRVQTPLADNCIAFGSGIAVRYNDLPFLVTNHHVIAEAVGPVLVCSVGGKWTAARVIATDPYYDLAVLDAGNLTKSVANVGRYDASHTYTLAGFADHGRLHFHPLWRGTFVFLDAEAKHHLIDFHGASCEGDSGGGIFNARGEVCCIARGKGGGMVNAIDHGPLRAILQRAIQE